MAQLSYTIPPGKVGDFEIRYRNGLPVLWQGKFEWMNLTQEELDLHKTPIANAFGTVFVAGLGLGYIVEQFNRSDKVNRIIVAEVAQEVADLVWDYIEHDKAELLVCDAYDLLREIDEPLDYVYGDLWDIRPHTVPDRERMRRIAQTKVDADNIFMYGDK
jgi:hypothetical protein